MNFKIHEYSHALVGKVSTAFRLSERDDLNEARRQHDWYLRLLKELNVEVIEVEGSGSFPDNLFLEDYAVICNGTVLLMKPLTDDDKKQVDALREVLHKDLNQIIVEVEDAYAKLVGSDVLFTGREFFVGISDKTNIDGAGEVAAAFAEFPCSAVKVPKGAGSLKKYITMAGPDVLCCGASIESKELLKRIEKEATYRYDVVTVPEDGAANCLYINDTLIHRAIEEIPESFKVFCEKIDYARRSICFSELSKVSNGLSSCCLLLKKS